MPVMYLATVRIASGTEEDNTVTQKVFADETRAALFVEASLGLPSLSHSAHSWKTTDDGSRYLDGPRSEEGLVKFGTVRAVGRNRNPLLEEI